MLRTGLVHDREVGPEDLRELDRHLRAAGIRSDRDDSIAREALVAEVLREERKRDHVVDRDREEALDLTGMQVHRQQAVGAGGLDQVGDEPGRDRLARPRLAVLPRVRVPRNDRGNPLGRGQLGRLDHDQQLHQVPIDWLATGLDEEDVGAADRFFEAAVGLPVRKRPDRDLAELDAEALADPLGKLGVRAAREEHQALLRPSLDPVLRLDLGLRRHRRDRLEAGQARQLSHRRPRFPRSCCLHERRSPSCSPVALGRRRALRAGRPW